MGFPTICPLNRTEFVEPKVLPDTARMEGQYYSRTEDRHHEVDIGSSVSADNPTTQSNI